MSHSNQGVREKAGCFSCCCNPSFNLLVPLSYGVFWGGGRLDGESVRKVFGGSGGPKKSLLKPKK